ncbi:MAG: hypothetical protein PHQ66_00905 [Candidatus Nanoarchaeia archaeon]|nr:hypothetical protein [Candidatus Nanoarchaeia archaeon]MDD5358463.1 hypothetical protein [Candidatus Nanoarchaeia archaeon]MDD5588977.1 hypothetical protein [Candidatus Nanoarchaeia archaeon]
MAHYGRKDCEHEWRYRKDGWEEGCVPAICIECGAFGCMCDIQGKKPSKEIFFDGYNSDANINGKWENPYVKPKPGEVPTKKTIEEKVK